MAGLAPKITATVITKNEEANIAACLESLSWVDEIVVLDSCSTDGTVDIARRYTEKVFVEPWRGQGHHKNRAVELAQGPWIISVDADERVTPELAREIRQAISEGKATAYAMRRKNFYQSQWIRHCGWWPDWVKRVFRKGTAQFSQDIIHDSLQTPPPIGRLANPILHHSFHSAEDFLERARWYAHNQAREMFAAGRRASAWTAVSHSCFGFLQTYIFRLGFLDGTAGLLIAVSNFVGIFYRYMMLRDLGKKDNLARPAC
jgi:glycosyltransferase involved in cell wall biosynthesis